MIGHGHHHIVIKNEAIVPGIKIVIVIGAAVIVIVIGAVIIVNVLLPEMTVIDPRRNGVARNGRATKLVLVLLNVMVVVWSTTVVGEEIEIICDKKEIQFCTLIMLVINILVEIRICTTSSMNNITTVIGWEEIILGWHLGALPL